MSKSMLARDLPSYRKQGSGRRLIRNIIVILLLVFIFVSIVEAFFVRTYRIQTDAMAPGISPGSLVMVSPLFFGKESLFSGGTWLDFASPKRGDLVMLTPPWKSSGNFLERIVTHLSGFFSLGRVHPRLDGPEQKTWEVSLVMRRVIALPGDQLYFNAGMFYVKPKGKADFSDELHLSAKRYQIKLGNSPVRDVQLMFSVEMPLMTLGPGEYFVASDNRESGLDSRHWGPIGMDRFRGLVLACYWPFRQLAWYR